MFSYPDLAGDLLSKDDRSAARSALWRGLIRRLGWPAGSAFFWPPCLDNSNAGPDKSPLYDGQFLGGVLTAKPRVHLLFGLDETAKSSEPLKSIWLHSGIRGYFLPAPELLLTDPQTLADLEAALSQVYASGGQGGNFF